MIKYETFKDIVATQIKDLLPPVFHSFDIHFIQVEKINESKEAMVMRPNGIINYGASPNIYLEDMYQRLFDGDTIDEILEEIAAIIVSFTGISVPEVEHKDLKDMSDKIVPTLVNAAKNQSMLEKVPHFRMMDLAVVYRFVVRKNDEQGFMTSLITNDVLECLEYSSEELHELAMNNMEKIMPVKTLQLTNSLIVLTNEAYMFGAAGILCMDVVEELAEKMQSDLYLVPSSVHEMMIMSVDTLEVHELLETLEKGNRMYAEADEYLSESIYYYERGSMRICPAYIE